jgi:DNA polymerase III epsilon subunit family exonuclease
VESLPERLAFVDVETTGLDAGSDRIIDVGVVTLDVRGAHATTVEWGTLLDPGRRVVRALPGVEPVEIADSPRFAEIAAEAASRLSGRVLVAHNARFDFAFLQAEFARCGIAFEPASICTLKLARWLGRGEVSLDALAQRFGVSAEGRHRALPDARTLCGIWLALRREYPEVTLCRMLSAISRAVPGKPRTAWSVGERLRKWRAAPRRAWSLQLRPDATVAVVPAGEGDDLYGLFDTERKARNALDRIDVEGLEGPRRLMELAGALSPLRIRPWPFAGPAALRERGELHVFDRWREGRNPFDPRVYKLLCGYLDRRPGRLVPLAAEVRDREPERYR